MEYTFSGSYTRDLFRFAAGVAKQSAKWFQTFRWIMLGVLLVGAAALTYFSLNNVTPAYLDALRIAIWVLLIIYFAARFFLSGKKQADAQWETIQTAPQVEGKITPFGVTLEYPSLQQSTPWNQIKEAVKMRGFMVLVKDDESFIAIPQQFAKDVESWNAMQNFVTEQVNRK